MWILILVLSIVAIILLSIFGEFDEYEVTVFSILRGFSVAFLVVSIIATLVCGMFVVNGRTISSKIEMYQTENQNIENQMNLIIGQYMGYESDIYKSLKSESSITLITTYPELKTDSLVTNELDVYVANNNKIKELKLSSIGVSNFRWWLYFGK